MPDKAANTQSGKSANTVVIAIIGLAALAAIAAYFYLNRIPSLSAAELQPDAVAARMARGNESIGKKKYQEALDTLLPLAASGHAEAQYKVGVVYDLDSGIALIMGTGQLGTVDDDFYNAVKWYEKAAEQGQVAAQASVGALYCSGMGHARLGGVDRDAGMKWLQAAADRGFAGAMYSLGENYLQGICTAADPQRALKWLTAASEHGNVWARHTIGLMYQSGTGVPKDRVESYIWFTLAKWEGAEEMRNHLTSQEMDEADRRIAAWRAKFEREKK